MKAVYEMPKVSFEAFMANSAVSSCGTVTGAFDCVLGDGIKDGWFDDNHGANDQPNVGPNQSLMASTAGLNGCTIQAGFADYVNGQGQGEDSVGLIDPASDNITTSTVIGVDYTGGTSSLAGTDGFMGWLYITFTGGKNGSYNTTGWNVNKTNYGSWLSFSSWGFNQKAHAWLAPLFSAKSTSGTI